MQRSHFIGLILGTAVAGLPACVGSAPLASQGITGWAARYDASLIRGAEGVVLEARVRKSQLQAALDELSGLANGAMRCDGNQATGRMAGEAFRLELRVA